MPGQSRSILPIDTTHQAHTRSTVMRDSWALRLDTKEPMILELSDDFEDCDLVECVLDLLTGRDTLPPDYISDYDMDRCKNLYYFARKWD
jgi:hypothetical protein